MPLSSRDRRFQDANNAQYSVAAREYAHLWQEHKPDQHYYSCVRAEFMKWIHSLSRNGVSAEDGAIVICGPGYDFAQRDMTHEMVDGMLANHPAIIAADWSPDILEDFDTEVISSSRKAAPKTILVQRDFSGGIASRLQALISSKLEEIRSIEDLREFISWLKNDVGYDEVMKAQPETTENMMSWPNPLVNQLNVDETYDFQSVLRGQAEVRFMTANLLLAGMLALTEKEVRDRIMGFRKEMRDEEIVEMLGIWHELVKILNTKIAANFIIRGLDCNPKAHMLMPTDVNTVYPEFDTFDRLDLLALRKEVTSKGYKFSERGQGILDDSHENPPHSHSIKQIFACANGGNKGAQDDAEHRSIGVSDIGVPQMMNSAQAMSRASQSTPNDNSTIRRSA